MANRQPNYLILGAGITGQSCARYLNKAGMAYTVFDTRDLLDNGKIGSVIESDRLICKDWSRLNLESYTHSIISPGFDPIHPIIKGLQSRGIPIEGDINFFARHTDKPIFAVTGTNGKSTVVSLVGEMANNSGKSIGIGGNIGIPVMDLLSQQSDFIAWGLELSSFQLESINDLKPKIATILNISDDHMDRYAGFHGYVQAKQRIYNHAQVCLYNRNDKNTWPNQANSSISMGLDSPKNESDWGIDDGYIVKGKQPLIAIDKIRLQGMHNWFNAMAAAAIAQAMTIETSAIIHTLQSFEGLEHRCQLINNQLGIKWINDSKGTNVGATVSALESLGGTISGKIVLIAGGQAKEADLTPLIKPVTNHVSDTVLIGQDRRLFERTLKNCCNIHLATTMSDAVAIAEQKVKHNGIVLLSPACASFDMFDNFEHRGSVFSLEVKKLLSKK